MRERFASRTRSCAVGPYQGDGLFAPNPIVMVEEISPSSLRPNPGGKLLDDFAVPSIRHYRILHGAEVQLAHLSRSSPHGMISTSILGRGDLVKLAPPGIVTTVDALFDS